MAPVECGGVVSPEVAPPLSATVVVPCLDGAAYLGGLLDSLAADPRRDTFEVVVADNGSTDESVAVATSYASRLRLRVVDAAAAKGRTGACNAGARAAASDYLVFLDVDDEASVGYVAAMRAALDDADVVAAFIDGERLNPPWVARTRQTGLREDGLSYYLGFLPIAGGCAMGVRRAVWQDLDGMRDIPYAEDVDFSWRAQVAGYTLAAAPGAVLHYRYRDTLRGIWTQAVQYGRSQPLLYRTYARHGLRRSRPRQVVREWAYLARRGLRVRSRADLGGWLYLAGIATGRVRGSLRHRTLFL